MSYFFFFFLGGGGRLECKPLAEWFGADFLPCANGPFLDFGGVQKLFKVGLGHIFRDEPLSSGKCKKKGPHKVTWSAHLIEGGGHWAGSKVGQKLFGQCPNRWSTFHITCYHLFFAC